MDALKAKKVASASPQISGEIQAHAQVPTRD